MRSRHILIVAGLAVGCVFVATILWEFLIEDPFRLLLDPTYVAQNAREQWYHLAIAVSASVVSILIPLIFIRHLSSQHAADRLALTESNERFKAILENPDWVWEIDAAGVYTYASPTVRTLLGHEPEEVIGRTPFDLMPPDEAERVAAEFAPITAERRPFSLLENVCLHKDGHRVVMESSGVPLFDKRGNFRGYRGVDRDISQRKTMEKALAESEERYRTAFHTSPDSINLNSLDDGRYLEVNEGFTEITGYSREEAVGRTSAELSIWHDPKDRERLVDALKRDGRVNNLEARFRRKDGKVITGLMSARVLSLDGQPTILSIARDISALKQAENALRASEERYRSAFHTSPDAINLNCLEDGRYLDVNQGFVEMMGYSREEVIGRTSRDIGLWQNPENRERMFVDLRRDGHIDNLEVHFRKKDGSTMTGLMSIRILDADDRSTFLSFTRDISTLKKTEEALRESEGRLRALLESSIAGMGVEDLEGRTIEHNLGLAKILGYEPEEFRSLHFTDYTHPDYAALDTQLFEELATGRRRSYQMEKRYIRKDGETVWGRLTRTLYTDADGRPRYCLGMMEDITERKRAEEELRQSRERFARVFQENPNLMAISALADGRLYEVNEKYLSVLGFSRDEVIGKTSAELGLWPDPAKRARVKKAFERNGVVRDIDMQHPTKSGETRDFLLNWDSLDLGNETAVLAVLQDVTERKQAEEALAASERRLDLALRASNDGLWDWDLLTDETFYSDRYKSILGYGPDEFPVSHQAFLDHVHPDDRSRIDAAIQRFKTGPDDRYENEFRMLHRDGHVLDIRSRGYLVRDENGRPVRATGTHTDMTELRAVQAQLMHAQRLQVVGQLAGGAAHDFNNLLQVVQSSLDIVQRQIPAADPTQRFLDSAVKAARRGGYLTHQLLSFSRTQMLRPQTLWPAELIGSMLDLIRRTLGEDIDIQAELDDDLPQITVDPRALENAILNIAINARAAMPRGGRLTVSAACHHLEKDEGIADEFLPAGNYVKIELGDTGCGMPLEVRERAFEPFFTTKEVGKGSGLGLSTVYGFAKQSGGTATLDSEPGKGTTVAIVLPVT